MSISVVLMIVGLTAALIVLMLLIWSVAQPEKRVWPPQKSSRVHRIGTWALTLTIFSSAIVLGLLDCNRFQWPESFRWGIGLPLILVGNVIAWREALDFGMATTSGAVGRLKTDGLYRYSRNPQYVADSAILIGWAILSASLLALPIVGAGILVLMVTPFAEEPWLKNVYGGRYSDYCRRTRRYI